MKLNDNLSKQIASYLSDQIISGVLKAEQRLLESKIATELNISRGPIREALLILEKNKLITLIPRKGAVVNAMDQKQIEDTFEILSELIQLLAAKVAKNWQNDDLEPLDAVLTNMKTAAKNKEAQAYLDASFAFLRACFPIANQPILEQFIEELLPSIARIQYQSLKHRPQSIEDNQLFFRKMVDAIKQRDVDQLKEVINQYSDYEQNQALSLLTA